MDAIFILAIVVIIVWNIKQQIDISGFKKWQNDFIDAMDEELFPIRQKCDLVEPWEKMVNEGFDEEDAQELQKAGYYSAEQIAEDDDFESTSPFDSKQKNKDIKQLAMRIIHPSKEEDN